ncbi:MULTISPECIES: TlpA family protein disulfide reductase [Pedobacter]|uniref:Alkyl hydroperoxide reductase/ Thiol specific antioxidant/ Mal allergen n=1 Tax=Pedobacter heparinus (strain ATCC 13125 / DSM 2366 / CIP 104194 / JCM 7457 / NBRC 12017 / NCIMB 9290 / NRRL B-14731 / HIM 762-3) TaxID=485917 RepID=C6Y1G8_PEDHD|nr:MULTISPECIES: TlpA disulfide reductase family protein [Pedobacter]ACU02944.1 alkyl hydroperoxide reductase/ Thiol specific antioxidant/ Mal allergen [Pedobacter heparinus DSM 2366]MBB5440691.1 peroxiredoxin [Pedobacter sp. AK017]
MKPFYAFLLLLTVSTLSCNQDAKKSPPIPGESKTSTSPSVTDPSKAGKPVAPARELLTDFMTFWNYYSGNVKLNQDFEAYDVKGTLITKEIFLKNLNSGLYFPLRVYTKSAELGYKLQEIPATADTMIPAYMKQFSKQELTYYKMQGKNIPSFNFTAIDGNTYTSENTKGKIVLFKCWFISCLPCVQEMPALNDLVKKYKDRKDILFISLAIDGKKELQQFLAKTRFDYATIPDQENYMSKKLNVTGYPTHFLIDKAGKLVRALHNETELAEALEKEIAL